MVSQSLSPAQKQELYGVITRMESAGEPEEMIRAVAKRYTERLRATAPGPRTPQPAPSISGTLPGGPPLNPLAQPGISITPEAPTTHLGQTIAQQFGPAPIPKQAAPPRPVKDTTLAKGIAKVIPTRDERTLYEIEKSRRPEEQPTFVDPGATDLEIAQQLAALSGERPLVTSQPRALAEIKQRTAPSVALGRAAGGAYKAVVGGTLEQFDAVSRFLGEAYFEGNSVAKEVLEASGMDKDIAYSLVGGTALAAVPAPVVDAIAAKALTLGLKGGKALWQGLSKATQATVAKAAQIARIDSRGFVKGRRVMTQQEVSDAMAREAAEKAAPAVPEKPPVGAKPPAAQKGVSAGPARTGATEGAEKAAAEVPIVPRGTIEPTQPTGKKVTAKPTEEPSVPKGYREVNEGEMFEAGREFRMDVTTNKSYVKMTPEEAAAPPKPAAEPQGKEPFTIQEITAKSAHIADANGAAVGRVDYKLSKGVLHVEGIEATGGAGALGPSAIRSLIRQMKSQHPEITKITGKRKTGATGDPLYGRKIEIDLSKPAQPPAKGAVGGEAEIPIEVQRNAQLLADAQQAHPDTQIWMQLDDGSYWTGTKRIQPHDIERALTDELKGGNKVALASLPSKPTKPSPVEVSPVTDVTKPARYRVTRRTPGYTPQTPRAMRDKLQADLDAKPFAVHDSSLGQNRGAFAREAEAAAEMKRLEQKWQAIPQAQPTPKPPVGEGAGKAAAAPGKAPAQPTAPQFRTRATVQADIEALKKQMAARNKPLRGGKRAGAVRLDPEDFANATRLGTLYVESGVRAFGEWSAKMIADVGQAIKPHLKRLYAQAFKDANDPSSRLSRAIEAAKPIRMATEQLQHEELARRVARLAGVQSRVQGQAGFFRELSTLKGELPKAAFESPISQFAQEEIDDLFLIARRHPALMPLERTNAQAALIDVFDGLVPQPAQIHLLGRVFGPELVKALRRKNPDGLLRGIAAMRRAGMLTGLRTQVRNLSGNTVGAIFDELASYPGALVDIGLSQLTGRRTLLASSPLMVSEGLRSAATKGMTDAWDVIARGGTPDELAKYEMPHDLLLMVKGREVKPLNWYVNFVHRMQAASDRPFREYAFRRAIVEQAQLGARNEGLKGTARAAREKELMKSPTEAMLLQAAATSEEAVFANRNQISEFVSGLKARGGRMEFLVDMTVPFVRVPSNIPGRALESTPLGAIWMLDKVRARGGLKALKADPSLQRQASKTMGRSITGTALIWKGYELAKDGVISASAPIEPSRRDPAQAAGKGHAAVKLGDAWYRLADNPATGLLVVGADLFYDQAQAKKPLSAAGSVLKSGIRQMLDFPMAQGVSDLVEAARYASRGEFETMGKNYVSSFAGSFVPTMAADIAGSRDEWYRRGRTPIEAVKARIPGLRGQVPIQHDALGVPMKRRSLVNPFEAAIERGDPVANEIVAVGASLTKAQRVSDGNRVDRDRNEAEYQERVRRTGEFVRTVLAPIIKTPDYKALPTAQRKTILESLIRQVKGQMSDQLKGERELARAARP